MKILVTGASGFVGGAFWRAARLAGHEVTALGRRPVAEKDYVARDLTQKLSLNVHPEVVVHAAARSSPWGSRREFFEQNVTATRHIVDFCTAHGSPLLVHVSTAAVMYTDGDQWNLDEEAPLPDRAVNRYAETKRAAEAVVRAYPGPWCIIRPRAVFGPGDTVVFPRILRAARAGRLPLIEAPQPVMGDLIYIDTLVDYLLRIIERRATGLYLLTNNQPVPILDFLGSILAQLGLPAPSRRMPVRRAMRFAAVVEQIYTLLPFLGEPPVTRFGVGVFAYSKTFKVTKTLRDLGSPSVSLAAGMERFVEWQRSQNP